jgi:hypothetical protein
LYDALDLKPTEQKRPIVKRRHRFKLKLANFWTSMKVPIHKENVMRKSLFLIYRPPLAQPALTVPDIKQGNSKLRNRVIGRSTSAGKNSGLSSQQIAEEVGLSTRAIRARMTALAQRGLVTAVGRSERDPLRKYFWRSTQGTPKRTRKQSAS